MRKLTVQKPWILAFLFVLALAGCGREQTRATLPTVIANSPVNGATAVLLNTTVSATFSSMMNPATINTTSFLLTGPGGTAVSGTVSYSGTTAVFMPSASLAANSVYNAVITTAAPYQPDKGDQGRGPGEDELGGVVLIDSSGPDQPDFRKCAGNALLLFILKMNHRNDEIRFRPKFR